MMSNSAARRRTSCSIERWAARSDLSGAGSSRIAWSRTGTSVGSGPRLGTGEQRHVVAELDQGVGQVGDNPFGAAVETGRDSLIERCNLGNLHKAPSMAWTS